MDRFVVGTGRCGSTLLSRMLNESPEAASIFEFFNGLDMTRRFTHEPASGAEFAKLIAQEHPFVTMVLSRGYQVPEIVYPFGPRSRYQRHEGLPWMLVAVAPRLSEDPDTLYDEMLAFAERLPSQPLSQHYRAFFDWLADRSGKQVWIERSGSSIDYLDSLRELFPGARFLHLHRDGREAALSMREHHAYRLAISLMVRHLTGDVRSNRELGELDPSGGEDTADEIGALLKSRPDAEHFGSYWSQQLIHGFRALRTLDADQYAEVRFEDVIGQPEQTLARICDFFELDPGRDGWIARAAGLVRGAPPARFRDLTPDEQRRLDGACRPGMELLGRPPG